MVRTEALGEDIARWFASYVPNGMSDAAWIDSGLRQFVGDQLARRKPSSPASAKQDALALARIGNWCLRQGLELEVEVILDPDTVERYCTFGLAEDPHAGDRRSRLRSLGRSLTRTAPWEPAPAPLKRRVVAAPYDQATVRAFCRDAARQSTDLRRRSFETVLSLGLGAGIDGRWVHRIHGTDVFTVDGVTLVQVPDPRARVVAVVAAWEDMVRDLAERAGEQLLIGGQSARNLVNSRVADLDLGKATPRPSCARLRSTWLVHHLDRGTRMPELAEAAGMTGITTLSDLFPDVPRLAANDAHRMLRGI